jgi:hypothetical protein
MTSRLLVLAACESDLFEWMERHPDRKPWMAVWPTRYHKLEGLPPFDRLAVTAAASIMQAAVAACLTRVKGPDGLTPGQRLAADEIGARMRGAT